MSVPEDWFEHRREDGELVGWIVAEGDDFATVDLLGRRRGEATDWLSAEERLDELGIGYLADIYAYWVTPEEWVRVRLLEVSTDGISVKEDDFGDATADLPRYRLPFPADERLVPLAEVGEIRER